MKIFLRLIIALSALFALCVAFDVVYRFLSRHSKKYVSNTDIYTRYDR